MNIDIPGKGTLEIEHLVLDFNGTIARDGKLMSNVDRTLEELAENFKIHVLTADTCGTVSKELEGIPCTISLINNGDEAKQKEDYVISLGAENVVCLGNGANDQMMLKTAALGIAVLEGEGTSVAAILGADIVARSIYDAMGMLVIPQRIIATLRS